GCKRSGGVMPNAFESDRGRMKRLLLASTLFSTLAVSAQEPAQPAAGGGSQDPFVQATFDDFRLRAVGPAIASGRVGSIAVHPENKQTWYIGVSSGGVWKTTNDHVLLHIAVGHLVDGLVGERAQRFAHPGDVGR